MECWTDAQICVHILAEPPTFCVISGKSLSFSVPLILIFKTRIVVLGTVPLKTELSKQNLGGVPRSSLNTTTIKLHNHISLIVRGAQLLQWFKYLDRHENQNQNIICTSLQTLLIIHYSETGVLIATDLRRVQTYFLQYFPSALSFKICFYKSATTCLLGSHLFSQKELCCKWEAHNNRGYKLKHMEIIQDFDSTSQGVWDLPSLPKTKPELTALLQGSTLGL